MSLEWFAKLKEYDSLSKMRLQHIKAIQEQNERLTKLQARKEARLAEIAELKTAYLTIQQELGGMDDKIKQSSQQRQRLIDSGGDEAKIKAYQQEIDQLETSGLELLEQSELNQQERDEAKEFLTGLEKTMVEIAAEVDAEKIKDHTAIANLDLRLASLQEELPDDYKNLLEKTLAKNLALGAFTRIDNGSCIFCRWKISKMDETEIDMQKKLKTCPQCSRIFIPYGT